jgi:CheY-like chemotaxis protein
MAGAQVDIVANGKEAVEHAVRKKYDIVLMDLQMPVMDGFEATQELRRTGYSGRIIALTAHALRSDRARCLANGFDEHVTKPVNWDLLFQQMVRLAAR